jgi:hypothetical protein
MSKLPYTPSSDLVVLRKTVDFKATPAASSAVVPVLDVPAGTFVLRAGYTLVTAEGGTAAGTLGDGADPDGFIAAVDLNAAAGTKIISAGATVGFALGKFYTTADTIDLVATNALDTAVVEFWAFAIQP